MGVAQGPLGFGAAETLNTIQLTHSEVAYLRLLPAEIKPLLNTQIDLAINSSITQNKTHYVTE